MRTIKFRGKSATSCFKIYRDKPVYKKGDWVYGWLFMSVFSYEKREINPYIIQTVIDNEVISVDVVEETIGQFTGLTDKDDAEIYEGDIVELREPNGMPNICKVEMCEKGYWCVSFGIHERIILGFIDKNQITVIGNIHDNPELLKNNNAQTN